MNPKTPRGRAPYMTVLADPPWDQTMTETLDNIWERATKRG